MRSAKNVAAFCLLCSTAVWLIFFGYTSAQTDKPVERALTGDGQTIQALLSEVHLLRLVLQRSNLNLYRAQIMI